MNETRPILLVKDSLMDMDLTLRACARRHAANARHVARNGEAAHGWALNMSPNP